VTKWQQPGGPRVSAGLYNMRQHAILSCLILLFGWAVFFGAYLFKTLEAVGNWGDKILFSSVIPLSMAVFLWHRDKCRHILFRANIWGFAGLACLLGLRLYAELMQQSQWQILIILFMIPFIILASLGFRAWRAWCFPSLAVLFAYPGSAALSNWVSAHITQWMGMLLPWSTPIEIPLAHYAAHWMILSAFYGYLRYPKLSERCLFYGLSLIIFSVIACVQLLGLSGLLHVGGDDLLSRFNLIELNQILVILGLGFLLYLLSVLVPYRPPMRRMMQGHTDFTILVDRHSHWLALTIAAVGLMALSAWLGI
jgi:hypothetical protein